MKTLLLVLLLTGVCSGNELLGYLEDWVNVKWWDNNIPGNCLMGCFEPQPYITSLKPYSSVNYGFTFLTENPTPSQVSCSNAPNGTSGGASGPCPVWDGKAIYLAAASKNGAAAITPSTSAATPGIVSIAESSRMAKMHPDGPKRFKISLGGWSDFARVGSVQNARSIAKLMGKLVLWTFADGVDLDFEHLTPFATINGDDEFAAYNALVAALREELDSNVKPQWSSFAATRKQQLQAEYNALQPWQQADMKPYYQTNMNFMDEVGKNGPDHLEVSWTTRFNAFLPAGNPWNYLLPGSPRPNQTFATDNEGAKIWPQSGASFDTANIMAYDAGTPAGALQLNFTTIMNNFVTYGKVPKEKINIGFEPGEQAAGGVWEGMAADKEIATYAKQNGFLGAFVWSVNPSPTTNPNGTKLAPELAANLNNIIKPTWRWGPAPVYTKCDPTTGNWPGL
eukprot:TRINITY_DN341_c0_g1_i6.p2 TRINITY_DN341_c0_g1~~TRINITY_DN341_c0_g1_i6.p2  ORF type:complete len:452 (+),score=175.86 TRINITY_DN341_c0_g1_i6:59-1414(+)